MDKFFEACKAKLEWYIKTHQQLKSDKWESLHAYRDGNAVGFYSGCDLIYEFDFGDYQNNLMLATQWLLEGQKDPLKKR